MTREELKDKTELIKADGFYIKEFQNHKHRCELEMINGKYAECPYKVKRKNMSYEDKCDECKHLRIVNLNDDGDVITGII